MLCYSAPLDTPSTPAIRHEISELASERFTKVFEVTRGAESDIG